uniref:RHD domain-containing protein n=1 Tax=Hippocampus comes TaxID=109280 RepID=A0A3Q3DMN6_HIPCM
THSDVRLLFPDVSHFQFPLDTKHRGFRFRYGCEGPSHGGLPGATILCKATYFFL